MPQELVSLAMLIASESQASCHHHYLREERRKVILSEAGPQPVGVPSDGLATRLLSREPAFEDINDGTNFGSFNLSKEPEYLNLVIPDQHFEQISSEANACILQVLENGAAAAPALS